LKQLTQEIPLDKPEKLCWLKSNILPLKKQAFRLKKYPCSYFTGFIFHEMNHYLDSAHKHAAYNKTKRINVSFPDQNDYIKMERRKRNEQTFHRILQQFQRQMKA